jgi:Mg2+/Co2+ transporter CorB
MLKLFGVRADPHSKILAVREEIAGAISLGHYEGAVQKEDRDRLLGALDLGERSIEEIMRHRSEIEMLDVSLPPQELMERALQSPHTRLPLYRGNQENVVGVLHTKDLLRAMYARSQNAKEGTDPFEGFNVLDVAMAPYFAPETTPLDDQMRQFLRRQTHFALVVDEYGVLQGLITLEDILEEIVGEITDEFDTENEPEIVRCENGDFLVDGATTIRDLNRATDWALPDDEANTVAGLVIHEAQSIPEPGQVFSFHGFRFEVVERQANRITRLRIRPVE